MAVNGTIYNGNYKIQHTNTGYASLQDSTQGSNLLARAQTDSDVEDIIFAVTRLPDGVNYTIQSQQYANYARANGAPKEGDPVCANSFSSKWIIRETGVKGEYLICATVNDALYWSLSSANPNTIVKLTSDDTRAHFKFIRLP